VWGGVGASVLHEVLPPPGDAPSALRRARGLLREFASQVKGPIVQLGAVATVEQLHQARRFFTRGSFWTDDATFRARARRLGAVCEEDAYRIVVQLASDLEALWPLPPDVELEHLDPGPDRAGPLWCTNPDLPCDESVLDAAVIELGPLALDAYWYAALHALPAVKLCGVELCLNCVWTVQCAEAAQDVHGVYLSIGMRNPPDARERWLGATGLRVGEALAGW